MPCGRHMHKYEYGPMEAGASFRNCALNLLHDSIALGESDARSTGQLVPVSVGNRWQQAAQTGQVRQLQQYRTAAEGESSDVSFTNKYTLMPCGRHMHRYENGPMEAGASFRNCALNLRHNSIALGGGAMLGQKGD
jgi:hypothetical protein